MTRLLAVDTETFLIRPGRIVPDLVCATFCETDLNPTIHHVRGGAATEKWLAALKDPDTLTVYHNGVFDLAVLANACHDKEDALRAVFNALAGGRIRDTLIRQKIFHIRKGDLQMLRKGSLSLGALSALYLKETMAKGEDTYRLRYGEFMDVPLRDWPAAAKDYALLDAKQTMRVFLLQDELFTKMKYTGTEPHSARDEAFQMRGAWALHLMSAWGIRTDPDKVNALARELETEIGSHTKVLQGAALVRLDGSQDMGLLKDRVIAAYATRGLKPPATAGGGVSTSKDTLEKVVDVDPLLRAVHERKHAEKILNTFVKAARQGTVYPLTASYNPLVASTRTSCSGSKVAGGCNMQNLPRKAGVRECFVPRPGHVFCDADYSTLEMRTLAQVCHSLKFKSKLREALVAGRDPHVELGARLARVSGEEFAAMYRGDRGGASKTLAKDFRQKSKAANFGFPGGLGARKFVQYAAATGVVFSEDEAKALRDEWMQTWPEVQHYFRWINSLMNPVTELANVPLLSGVIRGACRYTVAANTGFQALAAYGVKEALWQMAVEMYTDRASDLYGSRGVAMIHDEVLVEVPEEHGHQAAMRIKAIMESAMMVWTPDVPQEVKPALMRCWDKEAKPVFDENMELIPFGDEEAAA